MNNKQLCLVEKAYYEWILRIHPKNPKFSAQTFEIQDRDFLLISPTLNILKKVSRLGFLRTNRKFFTPLRVIHLDRN